MSVEIPLRNKSRETIATAIVDDQDAHLAKHHWCLTTSGYVRRGSRGSGRKYIHILMHRELLNPPKEMDVDHINGNRLDNRRCNLRVVDRSQNLTNRTRLQRTNTSGFRNVSWDASRRKWGVKIKLGRRQIHGGRFNTLESAVIAAQSLREQHGFLTNSL